MEPSDRAMLVCLLVCAYVLMCRLLRFRRVRSLEASYSSTHANLAVMSIAEAHEIRNTIAQLEFPALYSKGLEFGFFRTYGIPSISGTLALTRQLTSPKTVAQRYADTLALVQCIYEMPPGDQRGLESTARLNYIHGHYIRKGQIRNGDMLYTLALAMREPCDWIDRYEWRRITDLEKCAMGLYHQHWGQMMHIDFGALARSGGTEGWRDGLQFFDELCTWAEEYESKHLVPAKSNHILAKSTAALLLRSFPLVLQPWLTKLMTAAMDSRLQEAIVFPKPTRLYVHLLGICMSARRVYLRHAALPRFFPAAAIRPPCRPDGALYLNSYDVIPIYVRPTWSNRWGVVALYRRLAGLPLPGDPGMCPKGFVPGEVGPKMFRGREGWRSR